MKTTGSFAANEDRLAVAELESAELR